MTIFQTGRKMRTNVRDLLFIAVAVAALSAAAGEEYPELPR